MCGCTPLDRVAPACLKQGVAGACGCILLFAGASARSQDIEPRAYSNAPLGVNFLIAGYAYTRGGLAFDPALPVSDPDLETSNALLAYARVLDLWGRLGKLDFILPYTWLSGSATRSGEPVERVVDGFADPKLRLSINLYGAPALSLRMPPISPVAERPWMGWRTTTGKATGDWAEPWRSRSTPVTRSSYMQAKAWRRAPGTGSI